MTNLQKSQELEQRTTKFGIDVVKFCQQIPETAVTRPLISQLIRSATSVGANYAEANNASSKKDFANKIYIAKKEGQETKHWLEVITVCAPQLLAEIRRLEQECHELVLIFNKVTATLRQANEKITK